MITIRELKAWERKAFPKVFQYANTIVGGLDSFEAYIEPFRKTLLEKYEEYEIAKKMTEEKGQAYDKVSAEYKQAIRNWPNKGE